MEAITSADIPCDLVFEDMDTSSAGLVDSIKMSRHGECDLRIPFRHEDVLELVENAQSDNRESLVLSKDGRSVYLFGEKIKLTDVEFRLLEALVTAEGDFVSRETLLASIWGDGFDAGVVNVYIHYLRHKLERDGRKIILSSRKEGYGIDRKYRRNG